MNVVGRVRGDEGMRSMSNLHMQKTEGAARRGSLGHTMDKAVRGTKMHSESKVEAQCLISWKKTLLAGWGRGLS